jgi:hypothetical protein
VQQDAGGYFGTDQRPSLRAVQRWIRTARLRWIAVPDLPPLHFGAPSLPPGVIAAPWGPWARAHCTAVPRAVWGGIDTKAFWRRYGHMPLHTPLDLYDCAGATVPAT